MLKIGSLSWKWCILVRSQKSITAFSSPNMHFQKSVSVEFRWRRKNAVLVIKTNTPVSGKEGRILKRKHGMLQVHTVVPHRKLQIFLLWNNVSKDYYITFSRPEKKLFKETIEMANSSTNCSKSILHQKDRHEGLIQFHEERKIKHFKRV